MYFLRENVLFACDIEWRVIPCTYGVEFLQGGISVGLIKAVVVVGVFHVSFWHIQEQAYFKRMGGFLVRVFLAYLCYYVDYRTRAGSAGKSCTYVESNVVVARRMLQTRHCIVQYVVEIAAAALVAQVVCHKHTSEPASLSAYSCCNKWPHVFVYQFLVVWIDKTL